MDAKETALAMIEFVTSDKSFKADVVDEVIDLLLGDDPTAIVKSIKGIPSSMVEMITDGISDALKTELKKRWGLVTP